MRQLDGEIPLHRECQPPRWLRYDEHGRILNGRDDDLWAGADLSPARDTTAAPTAAPARPAAGPLEVQPGRPRRPALPGGPPRRPSRHRPARGGGEPAAGPA